MGDDELFKFLAPLTYRAADKFFKFVSWAIIITVIGYAKEATGSRPLSYLHMMAITIFAIALFLQAAHLAVRDPADWNIPPHLRLLSRVLQVLAGFTLILIISSPYFVMDTMMADIARARTH